jgi:hypothetical protein
VTRPGFESSTTQELHLSHLGRLETKFHIRTKQNVTVMARAVDKASLIMSKEQTYLQAVSFTSNCMEMLRAAHVLCDRTAAS